MVVDARNQMESKRPAWASGELFDPLKVAAINASSWERAPGVDDPEEGDTITLGEFLAAVAIEKKRRLG